MRVRKFLRTVLETITKLMFIAAGIVICAPVLLVVTGSVMGKGDLYECLAPVFEHGTGFVTWKLIPQYPTIENYIRLLFYTPEFFVLFWNCLKSTVNYKNGKCAKHRRKNDCPMRIQQRQPVKSQIT